VKVLAFVGSPRKGGNTDVLVEEVLRGAQAKGHSAEKLYLYDYEIAPCIDCRSCKKNVGVCILRDGMKDIYSKIEKADVVVFGTPVYWYGPTGKMKLLIDRLRPFIVNKKLEGKKGMLVCSAAEGAMACGPTFQMVRLSLEYLGMCFAGKIFVKASEKGEVNANHRVLKKARELGSSL
jgi:multimeric flavodoxin WrbA